MNRVNALAAAAIANGEGFVADATQVQGIVVVDNVTSLELVPTGDISPTVIRDDPSRPARGLCLV